MATQSATKVTATAGGVIIKTAKETFSSDFKTCSTGGYVSAAVEDLSRVMIYVEVTSSTASSAVTIKAGDYSGEGIGDKDYTCATNKSYIIGGLDGTRFKASASSSTAGTAGVVTVYASGSTVVVGFLEVDNRL